jgi:hypothetical protein
MTIAQEKAREANRDKRGLEEKVRDQEAQINAMREEWSNLDERLKFQLGEREEYWRKREEQLWLQATQQLEVQKTQTREEFERMWQQSVVSLLLLAGEDMIEMVFLARARDATSKRGPRSGGRSREAN